MALLDLYFRTHGRIGRLTWWLGSLGIALAWLGILLTVLGVLGDRLTVPMFRLLVVALALIGAALMTILGTKRFHDRGKAAVPRVAPFVAIFALRAALAGLGLSDEAGGRVLLALDAALLAYAAWLCLELGCLRGTPGRNAHGDDPLLAPAEENGGETGALPA